MQDHGLCTVIGYLLFKLESFILFEMCVVPRNSILHTQTAVRGTPVFANMCKYHIGQKSEFQ